MEQQAKHTPGPWQVSAGAVDNPRLIVENDLGLPVCAMSLRGVQGDTRVMEANARLIAAAPDLLEAMQEVAATEMFLPDHPRRQAAYKAARAAIAKATHP